jgi:Activator of Hsp90 ATPase homolog 1-like protein
MADDVLVNVSLDLSLDPATAFEIFTAESGRWWQPGPINWNDSGRAVGMRFDPGPGGRWAEVYRDGDEFEFGRTITWEPGRKLAFIYGDDGHALDGTEVEVRFDEIPYGTRVTLEHRGWAKVDPEALPQLLRAKRWGWPNILGWYANWATWGSPLRFGPGER